MKQLFLSVAIAAATLAAIPAAGQHFDSAHRHAIEISTGIPPRHSTLGFDYGLLKSRGIDLKLLFIPSVNIGYTFCLSERWDLNAIFNFSEGIYRMSHYPAVTKERPLDDGTVEEYETWDFDAEPTSVTMKTYPFYSLMADVRFKWYRSDKVRLYSALGAGVIMDDGDFTPTPYITPVGVNLGANHGYFLLEATVSSAATFLLIGGGWRF